MKIKVTLKDQDVLHDAIVDAVLKTMGDVSEDEHYEVLESRIEKAKEVTRIWFRSDEYLRVEIDTDTKTCIVIPWK